MSAWAAGRRRREAGAGVTVEVRPPARGDPTLRLGLVHGLGASASVYRDLVALLPDGIETWTFGFPWDASGGSEWAWERDSRVWVDRALELVPRPPDVWLGHSFGANVLLDRIVVGGAADSRAVVLLSPFFGATPDEFDWSVISHYFNDFDDLIRAGIVARRGNSDGPAELLDAMTGKVLDRIGPYGWMRFFDLYTRTPLLDLSRVDVPCLVVGGGRDTASYPHGCRALAGALPYGRVEILPASGHFPMVDDAARVAALVGGFVAEVATAIGYSSR